MQHIFVIGCGHTGTTLISSIFAAHIDFHVVTYETKSFFPHEGYPTNSYKQQLDAAFKDSKAYILEKTPKHIYHVDKILTAYPNSKFIITTRNAKDTVSSLMNRTGNFRESLNRWITDNNEVLKLAKNHNNYLLKYEDLIQNPQLELKKLCEFLGATFNKEMLNFHNLKLNWFNTKHPRATNGVGLKNHIINRAWQMQQPMMDCRGRWKSELSTYEELEIEKTCSQIMTELGYNLITTHREIWYKN